MGAYQIGGGGYKMDPRNSKLVQSFQITQWYYVVSSLKAVTSRKRLIVYFRPLQYLLSIRTSYNP